MLQLMLPAGLCGSVAQLVAPGVLGRGKRAWSAVVAAAAAQHGASALGAHGGASGEHQSYMSALCDAGSCLRSSALQPDRSGILMRWRGHGDPIQGVFQRLTQRAYVPHCLMIERGAEELRTRGHSVLLFSNNSNSCV